MNMIILNNYKFCFTEKEIEQLHRELSTIDLTIESILKKIYIIIDEEIS